MTLFFGYRSATALPALRPIYRAVFVLFVVVCLTACDSSDNRLERIKAKGEILVLTRNGATTYYEGPEGPTGLEYDLAHAFADYIGVQLRIETLPDTDEIVKRIAAGKADIGAAGLTITEERRKLVRFAPPYYQTRPQIVYRLGAPPPRDARDIIGRQLEVVGGSGHVASLQLLKRNYPALSWKEVKGIEPEELLLSVWEGLLEFTVADSDVLALNRQYYPELQAAFDIDQSQQLAWALAADGDESLYHAVAGFFEKLRERELARIIERYYGPARRFNYVNTAHFLSRVRDTLPAYRDLFMNAGLKYNIDWRLLAAIGYQESYWDPAATSPTGVKGIMMLTYTTSLFVGITDREDPGQSIEGGARYLRSMMDRMPPAVLQPDRTWMALAAYNIGLSHLEDARIITQTLHGDPNKWHDVEKTLPLLANPAWYSKAKYGYARGYEPIQFVHRIRSFYNTLVKLSEDEKLRNNPIILQLKAPAI